jgi:hypothetical protein
MVDRKMKKEVGSEFWEGIARWNHGMSIGYMSDLVENRGWIENNSGAVHARVPLPDPEPT